VTKGVNPDRKSEVLQHAKIGQEDVYRPVSGIHTLHDISNKNGELICEYAVVNNMSVMSTKF
jgi:hypothetical protein